MTRTAALIVVPALALTHAAVAAQRSAVRMYTSIGEYYSTVYVPPPSGDIDHVFLRGEPLTIRVRVANEGDKEEVIRFVQARGGLVVRVAASESQKDAIETSAGAAPLRRGRGQPGLASLPATLRRSEGLQWDVSIPGSQQLPPGRYRILVDSGLERAGGGAIEVNNDAIVVEIRDVVTLAERVESLRIAATRALFNHDYVAAETRSRELLEIYPSSAYAHILIAQAAAARLDPITARAAYHRALALLRGRGDTLYVNIATEHSLSELIAALEGRLNAIDRYPQPHADRILESLIPNPPIPRILSIP